jgi:hypothetical protein
MTLDSFLNSDFSVFAEIWLWAIAIMLLIEWFWPIIRVMLLALLAITVIGLPIVLVMLGG